MTLASQFRFAVLFLGIYVAMQAAYYVLPDAALHAALHHAVVKVASQMVNLLTPAQEAVASGQRLYSREAALEVIRGCDGSGAAFMLTAAVLAFGASSWRRLIAGAAGAAALIYVLNQIRIVALYYVLADSPARFDVVHEYVAPLALIAASTVFFLLWAQRGAFPPPPGPPPSDHEPSDTQSQPPTTA